MSGADGEAATEVEPTSQEDAAAVALVPLLPQGDAWVRSIVEERDSIWCLRYAQIQIGEKPRLWFGDTWRYQSVFFVSDILDAGALPFLLSTKDPTSIRLDGVDVQLPAVQPNPFVQRRASFEMHDQDQMSQPSLEITMNEVGGSSSGISAAGRSGYLVGPNSPTFTDLDWAYRAYFYDDYRVRSGRSVPSELMRIRVVDKSAWIGRIRVGATQLTVRVEGHDVAGACLEYTSTERRQRVAVDSPGDVEIALPEGLPPENVRLWLTRGHEWKDHRALTPPWTSDAQLAASEVEIDGIGRDEQAVIEAIVFGGEGPLVEFKSELPEGGRNKTDKAFKTVAAFANGQGGTLVFGVNRDEVTVTGLDPSIDLGAARDDIGRMIRSRVQPTPDFHVANYEIDGKIIIAVSVEAGDTPPYGFVADKGSRDKPEYYVRRGASNYPALPSDLNQGYHRVAAASRPPSGPTYWRG